MSRKYSEPLWRARARWYLNRWRPSGVRRRRAAAIWQFRNAVRSLRPGSVAVDCGANIGEITRSLLERGAVVHAFEPDPYAHAILTSRLGGNPNLVIHAAAVGAQEGQATLFRTMAFGNEPVTATLGSSLIRNPVHGDDHNIVVPVVGLSSFIEQLQRPIDILKLDVEGAEAEILESLIARNLTARIKWIFVETHERFSATLADRIARLRAIVAERRLTNINLDWP